MTHLATCGWLHTSHLPSNTLSFNRYFWCHSLGSSFDGPHRVLQSLKFAFILRVPKKKKIESQPSEFSFKYAYLQPLHYLSFHLGRTHGALWNDLKVRGKCLRNSSMHSATTIIRWTRMSFSYLCKPCMASCFTYASDSSSSVGALYLGRR